MTSLKQINCAALSISIVSSRHSQLFPIPCRARRWKCDLKWRTNFRGMKMRIWKLASCLIMHGHFRHTPTMRNCRSFGCVLLSNQIYLTTMYRSTIPFQLSDQSALEIRVIIKVRLKVALYFSIFSRRIKKTSTLSSANFTESSIMLKERTHLINNNMKLYIPGVRMNRLGN